VALEPQALNMKTF